jgi:hypothetical protein
MSPGGVVYEPHGFIPLCLVVPVAAHDKAGDYFSHAINEQNNYNQVIPDTADTKVREAKNFTKDSQNLTANRVHRHLASKVLWVPETHYSTN